MSADPDILCVGLACLDIINLCDRYPAEDEDIRANDQRWTSGGNANNSVRVLALLGRRCEFLGTLGRGMETDFVLSLLDKTGVTHHNCIHHAESRLPTSYIVLNTANGSRTIVHYRNLPELTHKDFTKVDLSTYSWIHFEGRNPTEYSKMIEHIRAYNNGLQCDGGHCPNKGITVSVEMEKKRQELASLVPLADVLLVSKDYSQYEGYHSMEEAVMKLRTKTKKGAIVVCAWGEKGAAASDSEGKVYVCGAFPPPKLIDTLAAGDTFNAGIIHMLSRGSRVQEALTFACRLAGAKCGMTGLEGIKDFDFTTGE